MNYAFDIEKWLNLVLSYFYRKTNIIKFLKALLTGVQTTHTNFIAYRAEILFKASYSCQQKSLAALLNKIFAADLGGELFSLQTTSDIKPKYYHPLGSDGSALTDPLYAGLGSELNTQPLYAGFGSEYNESISFIVYAPSGCAAREAEIKSWVNYYRFESKDFKIIYI